MKLTRHEIIPYRSNSNSHREVNYLPATKVREAGQLRVSNSASQTIGDPYQDTCLIDSDLQKSKKWLWFTRTGSAERSRKAYHYVFCVYIILQFTLLSSIGHAQSHYLPIQPDPVLETHRWRTYSELLGYGLRCMAEDHSGHLWFGTDNGALRYDGKHWTEYGSEAGLLRTPVDVLFAARDGRLYAGSQYGISEFVSGRWRSVFPLNNQALLHVDAIKEASDGSIWAATAWGALNLGLSDTTMYTSDQMRVVLQDLLPELQYITVPDRVVPLDKWNAGLGLKVAQGAWLGMPRESAPVVIWSLAAGGPAQSAGLQSGDQIIAVDGQFTISRNRIKRYSPKPATVSVIRKGRCEPFEVTLTQTTLEGGARDFHVSDVVEAMDGTLWFVLYEGEVVHYDPQAPEDHPDAWRLYSSSDGLGLSWSPRITQTRDGVIWVISGDSDAGINRFDGTDWTHVRLSSMGASDVNSSILQTDDGTVWIGGSVLSTYRDGRWTTYPSLEDKIPSMHTQLIQSFDGALWVAGMGQAVARLERGVSRWVTFKNLHYQLDSSDGTSWFIESKYGVVRENEGQWVRYGVEDGLMDRPVALIETIEGEVWAAGSHNGKVATARLEGDTWFKQIHEGFSTGIHLNSVFRSTDGALWFGSVSSNPSGGVLKYTPLPGADDLQWRHFPHPEAPPYVYSISEYPDGVLWFGGHQLYRFTDAGWTRMAQPEALSSYVLDIKRAGQGGLWVGTRAYGVLRLDNTGWKQYDVRDGLSSNRIEAILPVADGTAWVASRLGIDRFDGKNWTASIIPSFNPSNVARGGLYLSREGDLWINAGESARGQWTTTRYHLDTRPPDTELTVSVDRISQDGDVLITWQGYDPWGDTPRTELQYSFRLDGGLWSTFSSSTSKTFFALQDGEHTFEVQARDREYNEDPTPSVLTFTVIPPVWKQFWFIGLMLLLVSVIGIQSVRVVQKKSVLYKSNKKLESINRDLIVASRAKSVFLANMSHELRTPLNVVLGYSQLMRRDTMLTPLQREHLFSINRSGEHLLGLIDSVLEISKIEAGRMTLESKVFDVHALLQDLSSMFQEQTKAKDLTLEIYVAGQVPQYVSADENKLRQVLINLMGNAIKFTERGGISLRATMSPETTRRLRIEIEDTGIGIPAADQQKIFRPFEQVLGTQDKQSGTGLGLAICREYVGIMGGELTVRSDNGHGSTFIFEVAIEPAPAAAIDRFESSSGHVVGLAQDQPIPRILVAEDQEANRALFVNLLQSVGFDVRGVSNGRKALEVWEEWSPHLIWMDVWMPEMDGLEATRRIKGTEKGQHTKIFALTAIAFEKDRDRILAAGCDDLVRKPYQESEIFEKMAEQLSIQYEFQKHERPEKKHQLSLEGLAFQDTEWLKALEYAARVGDLDAILDLIGQVQQDYPELGQSLSSLAGEFQFDEILKVTQYLLTTHIDVFDPS